MQTWGHLTLMLHVVSGEKPSCPGLQLNINLLDCLSITLTLDTGLGGTTKHQTLINMEAYGQLAEHEILLEYLTAPKETQFYLWCWYLPLWRWRHPSCCKLRSWTECTCPHLQLTHWRGQCSTSMLHEFKTANPQGRDSAEYFDKLTSTPGKRASQTHSHRVLRFGQN